MRDPAMYRSHLIDIANRLQIGNVDQNARLCVCVFMCFAVSSSLRSCEILAKTSHGALLPKCVLRVIYDYYSPSAC
jgi:hypothetical protein